MNGLEHRLNNGIGFRRESAFAHRFKLIVDERRRYFEFSKRRIGVGIDLPSRAHLSRIDVEESGMIDVDQVNVFEERIAFERYGFGLGLFEKEERRSGLIVINEPAGDQHQGHERIGRRAIGMNALGRHIIDGFIEQSFFKAVVGIHIDRLVQFGC